MWISGGSAESLRQKCAGFVRRTGRIGRLEWMEEQAVGSRGGGSNQDFVDYRFYSKRWKILESFDQIYILIGLLWQPPEKLIIRR